MLNLDYVTEYHFDIHKLSSNINLTLFVSCDSKYYDEFFEKLLYSAALNSPGINLILEIINPTRENLLHFDGIKSSITEIRLELIVTKAKFFDNNYLEVKAYYTVQRFLTLAELIGKINSDIFMVDIDSLIIRSIYSAQNEFLNFDIAVYDRFHSNKIGMKILASSIFFKNTPNTKFFFEKLRDKLRYVNLDWYVDQEVFFKQMLELKDTCKFASLKKKFIDFDFCDSSIVWAAKGDRKNDEKFNLTVNKIFYEYKKRAGYCEINPNVLGESFVKALCALQLISQAANSKIKLTYSTSSEVVNNEIQYGGFSIDLDDLKYGIVKLKHAGVEELLVNDNFEIFRNPETLQISSESFDPTFHKKTKNVKGGFKKYLHNCMDFILKNIILIELNPKIFSQKTVALVGNAENLKDKGFSELIDSHDIVIRFNLGSPFVLDKRYHEVDSIVIDGGIADFIDERSAPPELIKLLDPNEVKNKKLENYVIGRDVGFKTTFWSTATIDISRIKLFKNYFDNAVPVWPHPKTRLNIPMNLLWRGVRILPDDFYNVHFVKGIIPSSGLIFITYLSKIQDIKKLSIFGFDFFKSNHLVRSNESFLSKNGKFPHSSVYESNFINSLLQSNDKLELFK